MSWLRDLRNDKRKRKVVDFVLQMQIAAEMLLIACVLFMLVLFSLYVPPLATLFSSMPLHVHQDAIAQLLSINSSKWPLFIIILVAWVFVTITFSHRIIGPYYKFTIMFRRYADRDLRVPLFLREHDYFRPLLPLINKTLSNFDEDVAATRDMIEKLKEFGSSLNSSEQNKIAELVKPLEDRLAHYQLKADKETEEKAPVASEQQEASGQGVTA